MKSCKEKNRIIEKSNTSRSLPSSNTDGLYILPFTFVNKKIISKKQTIRPIKKDRNLANPSDFYFKSFFFVITTQKKYLIIYSYL